jgi:hypothetical protein
VPRIGVEYSSVNDEDYSIGSAQKLEGLSVCGARHKLVRPFAGTIGDQ